MDNIARSLISGLLSRLGIPEGTGHYEENFHKVIKNCSLDLSSPRINKAAVDLLLEGEFEYAYFQVLFNSVIPEGPAEEFMEGSVKFRTLPRKVGITLLQVGFMVGMQRTDGIDGSRQFPIFVE